MILHADQLHEILVALGARRDAAGPSERRSFFRVGARYKVRLRTAAAPGGVDAWLRDVSAGGLGISSPAAVAIGDSVTLELPRRDGSRAELSCLVRNCRRTSADTYQLGVTHLFSIDALKPLPRQVPAHSP